MYNYSVSDKQMTSRAIYAPTEPLILGQPSSHNLTLINLFQHMETVAFVVAQDEKQSAALERAHCCYGIQFSRLIDKKP